jgi:carbon monoxide dehydrogenase subunit G
MELTFRVKKTVEYVFDHLTDMQKFVSVHPVITKIEKIGNDSYLVYEMLKIGLIPFAFTYPATIEKNGADKVVIIRATVFKLTKIEMTFILKADNDYTVIEEHIQFKSPLPLKLIMQSVFRKQHHQLFKNIEMKEIIK